MNVLRKRQERSSRGTHQARRSRWVAALCLSVIALVVGACGAAGEGATSALEVPTAPAFIESGEHVDFHGLDGWHFMGTVTALDEGQGTLQILESAEIIITADTSWNLGGDFTELSALADAVAAGVNVSVEGYGDASAVGRVLAGDIRAERASN